MQESKTYFERFNPDYSTGLSADQVAKRMEQGLFNGESDIQTKSVRQIILENIITPFNILNAILAFLIILVGSYKNLLFMGVIISNVLIGTFQEIRAKRTIDKLALIASPKARVIRDGIPQTIAINALVLDDIMLLESGNQICADCVLIQGNCEVNESLLTGESDPIAKGPGDILLSGSFIVSGTCHAKVEHVGKDNYASKITDSAKYVKEPNSEIMTWINRIIKFIGFTIIPIGVLLFYKQFRVSNQPLNQAVVSTVAALVGMIPEGLVLLTSVVLAVSVIRLSRHKTLVQELYCIETLARVDTLCLDKTGTITEGTMQVDGLAPLEGNEESLARQALYALTAVSQDNNPTFAALREHFSEGAAWECTQVVPFSSARKWSGASFAKFGTYVLGAAEFVMKDRFEEIRNQVEKYSSKGQRVLLLAFSPDSFHDSKELPDGLNPIALVLLSDKIRPEARKTLEYFSDQGVDLKVISGDNAITVSNIAQKAGLRNANQYVDATTLHSYDDIKAAAEKYAVFGRVTPQQKLELVKALKEKKHTVAMTGDGVNDVLALKEADCSIAMASGSDAARTVSQLVLLDSNFASMPMVVQEGRRSINNLQRSASLFLVKTFFSAIIAVFFILVNCDYPFQPIQFTLINAFTIGAPSFILALEPNKDRIRGKFIVNIIKKALPGMTAMSLNIMLLVPISAFVGFSDMEISTLAVILTGATGLINLMRVCMPFNLLRSILFYLMVAGFLVAILFFQTLFSLTTISVPMLLILIPMLALAGCTLVVVTHIIEKIIMRRIED